MTTRHPAQGKGSIAAELQVSRARARGAQVVRPSSPAGLFALFRGFLGRHISVRGKLTIWYGLMCAVTLSLAGSAMSIYLTNKFAHDVDSNLIETAGLVHARLSRRLPETTQTLSQYQYCGTSPYIISPFTVKLVHLPQIAVQYCRRIQTILRLESSQLSQPGQFETVTLGLPNGHIAQFLPQGLREGRTVPSAGSMELFSEVAGGVRLFRDIPNFSGESFRVYLTPLSAPLQLRGLGTAGGDYRGVLAVYQNLHTYQQIQNEFNFVLLLGIPLGVVIAILAGWWIARAALHPLDRFSRTVRAIGESSDLQRRLHFVGPSDEVGRLAETFDGMMDRLERVFENQKRFIQDASHELRTPLTAIRGNADLMLIAPPEERDICIAAIRQESQRMSRLVTDLLLLAEADVADHALQMHDVDLDELAAEAYRSGLVLAGDRVSVTLERADPVCVRGDADRLRQLLLNLVDNAVKFTPVGGSVSVRVYADGGDAVVEVADSGVGIPPEDQEAIFRRFYRVETSRATRGSGLGLAITAWIAEMHGGTIAVDSQPGKGSTFTVRLPIAGSTPHTSNADYSAEEQVSSHGA